MTIILKFELSTKTVHSEVHFHVGSSPTKKCILHLTMGVFEFDGSLYLHSKQLKYITQVNNIDIEIRPYCFLLA